MSDVTIYEVPFKDVAGNDRLLVFLPLKNRDDGYYKATLNGKELHGKERNGRDAGKYVQRIPSSYSMKQLEQTCYIWGRYLYGIMDKVTSSTNETIEKMGLIMRRVTVDDSALPMYAGYYELTNGFRFVGTSPEGFSRIFTVHHPNRLSAITGDGTEDWFTLSTGGVDVFAGASIRDIEKLAQKKSSRLSGYVFTVPIGLNPKVEN